MENEEGEEEEREVEELGKTEDGEGMNDGKRRDGSLPCRVDVAKQGKTVMTLKRGEGEVNR